MRRNFCAALSVILRSVLVTLPVISLAGCVNNPLPQMREISDFEVIQVLGVDKSREKPGEVEVTLVAGKAGSSDGGEGGGDSKVFEITSVTAPTISEAVARMNLYTDKKQHLGYIDFLLIGEDAAREDITKYTDFFARDHEARYSTCVFLIRGAAVREFLQKTASGDRYIADTLPNLLETVDALSISRFLKIIDLIGMLDDRGAATVIPALELAPSDGSKLIGGESPENIFIPAGYAVVKDFRLAGFIEPADARGYNNLMGLSGGASASVPSPDGSPVAFDLWRDSFKVKPRWDGGALAGVTVQARFSANITEQHCLGDLYTEKTLAALREGVSQLLKGEMERAAAVSKELKADCFGLSDRVRTASPVKWYGVKDKWTELYPELELTIEVDTQIRRPYDIREPNGYDADKEKSYA